MMKKLFLLLLMTCGTLLSQGQVLNEWFNQKSTQRKYLSQQIAALKVYAGYLRKGYSIAKDGLNTIHDLKNGEFRLHESFFDSLKSINPKIKHYAKIAEMLSMQGKILKQYQTLKRTLTSSSGMHESEVLYIGKVFSKLLDGCERTLDELATVMTPGELTMSDDERIQRIDALHEQMTDDYTFCKRFSNEALLLKAARDKERSDLQTSRALNGLKN